MERVRGFSPILADIGNVKSNKQEKIRHKIQNVAHRPLLKCAYSKKEDILIKNQPDKKRFVSRHKAGGK